MGNIWAGKVGRKEQTRVEFIFGDKTKHREKMDGELKAGRIFLKCVQGNIFWWVEITQKIGKYFKEATLFWWILKSN